MSDFQGMHFIDSSVFLSVILNDKHAMKAIPYINRVQNSTFDACISHLVIGEIGATIRDQYDPNTNFDAFFYAIQQLTILLKGVKLHVSRVEDYIDMLQKFKELEHRVSPTDVKIISDAVTSKAKKLITFDTKYNTKSVDNMIEVINLANVEL